MALAIIEKAEHAVADHADEQIEPSIAIQISEHRCAIVTSRKVEPGFGCDIRKPPIAKVFEKAILIIEAAEKQIDAAVVIVVARGHAGSIIQHAVFGARPLT